MSLRGEGRRRAVIFSAVATAVVVSLGGQSWGALDVAPKARFSMHGTGPWGHTIDICVPGLARGTPVTLAVTDTYRRPPTAPAARAVDVFKIHVLGAVRTWVVRTYRMHSGQDRDFSSCSIAELTVTERVRWLAFYVNQTGELAIKVTSGGRLLGQARYQYRIRNTQGRTIWQGTDDFVNICINRTLTVLSQGGRLYCMMNDSTAIRLRRVP